MEPLISILWLLVYIGVIVGVGFVILWFLGDILGLPLPQRAIRIFWGCVALIIVILLLTWFSRGGFHFPMPN